MTHLITYLINLDDSTDRLAAATAQLEDAGMEFERRSAFDGRGMTTDAIGEYDEAAAIGFYGRPMTGGELGCYISHIDCARAFLESGAKYGLVLEDDVRVLGGSAEIVQQLVEWIDINLPAGWDIINLGKAPKKMRAPIAEFQAGDHSHTLERAFYFPVTTTAILWSREGAERFVATTNRIYAPLDHFMRRWLSTSGRGLAMQPALFEITGVESDLDNEGDGIARKRVARTPAYFLREFRRQAVNYVGAAWNLMRHLTGIS